MRLALAILVALGCGGDEPAPVYGPPTGTTCPPNGTTLTYANFGQQFMERYCTRCHHSALTGDARMGAPSFHDFDTYFGIRGVATHIDETTAAGPDAINRGMPPSAPAPSDEERQMLGEWIACDLPE